MEHLLKLKYAHCVSQVRISASASVPFRPTMVQMPNLALIEKKRITVYIFCLSKEMRQNLKIIQELLNIAVSLFFYICFCWLGKNGKYSEGKG
jgi:hypothetical protein